MAGPPHREHAGRRQPLVKITANADENSSLRTLLAKTLLRGRPRHTVVLSTPKPKKVAIEHILDIQGNFKSHWGSMHPIERSMSYPTFLEPEAVDPETLPSHPNVPGLSWTRLEIPVPDDAEPSQAVVPMLIALTDDGPVVRPAIVLLHGTGRCAESMAPIMASLAAQGMLVVAPDARYHGRRCAGYKSAKEHPGNHQYQQSLVRAWQTNGTIRPFGFDTAADMFYVADYLQTRPDVGKLAICGVSLGGVHAWLAGAADIRWEAVVPLIGVQSFKSAIANNQAHARVATIPHVFHRARQELVTGKSAENSNNEEYNLNEIADPEVVQAVWHRICPGLLDHFDAEKSLSLIAPRSLFVGNGKFDPRCPIDLLSDVFAAVRSSYATALSKSQPRPGVLELRVYKCAHEVTNEMWKDVSDFLRLALCAH